MSVSAEERAASALYKYKINFKVRLAVFQNVLRSVINTLKILVYENNLNYTYLNITIPGERTRRVGEGAPVLEEGLGRAVEAAQLVVKLLHYLGLLLEPAMLSSLSWFRMKWISWNMAKSAKSTVCKFTSRWTNMCKNNKH